MSGKSRIISVEDRIEVRLSFIREKVDSLSWIEANLSKMDSIDRVLFMSILHGIAREIEKTIQRFETDPSRKSDKKPIDFELIMDEYSNKYWNISKNMK